MEVTPSGPLPTFDVRGDRDCHERASRGQRVPFPSMSPASGLRPAAPPSLPGKGTRCPRPTTAEVFGRGLPPRSQAKVGGPPPTEVKEEGRAQPGPGDMEWEGARRPWHAEQSNANATGRSALQAATQVLNFGHHRPRRAAEPLT
jgi:hypothetical protein